MKKLALFMIVLLIFAGIGAWVSWQRKIPLKFWDDLLPMPVGEKVAIMIQPNQTTQEIIKSFVEEGVVKGTAGEFARWLTKFGIDRKLLPGRYELIPASAWDVARQMRGMKPENEMATIIPGTNIYTFGDIFVSGDNAVKELLNDSLYPKDMLAVLPGSAEGRVAFLLPETYMLVKTTPQNLIKEASRAWWKEFGSKVPNDPDEARRIAIIASLIEREALWDEERPKIAGVIYNRIEKKMLLQIDAAVVHAHLINGRRLTRVLYKDLEIDSPYNLYLRTGLTPEPICSPSAPSWEAALNPEWHDLLYYVADKDGHHLFGKTNAEHVQNIKKVRNQ